MKKVISSLLAFCIVLSSAFMAFAGEKKTSEKVMEQMEGAVAYLTDGASSYTIDNALDYYTLVDSCVDLSKYNEGFLKSVKENLDANNGKLISAYGESLTTYGAVILTLDLLGEDPADFYGYDITKAFTAMDATATDVNPYYYRVIIPATQLCENADEFTKTLCDTYINTYYVMGKGLNYFGFSCDNVSYFITAIAPYASEYPEIIKDAFTVLESYKVDGGYMANPEYGTEPNTDSTALALMAYCSYLDVEDDRIEAYFAKINSIYNDLCKYEGSKTGVFISSYSGTDDAYATREALMGLEKYYIMALVWELIEDEEESTTAPETSTSKQPTKAEAVEGSKTTKPNTSKKSPATGASTLATASILALFTAAGAVTLKKKDEAK